MTVTPIVEGDGEVSALPVLLRRISDWRTPGITAQITTPIRVRKDRFLNKDAEFSRYLQLAALKAGADGWVILLLDADDSCPVSLGQQILERARSINSNWRLATVLANREYESWFIAAAPSLHGHKGFVFDPGDQTHLFAEIPRDAKGWINKRMGAARYRETIDQASFSSKIDLRLAFENSRSFRKLCTEWDTNAR